MKTAFGICRQAFIPMRDEPSEKSEQVSQVLFGEIFTITGKDSLTNFSQIKLEFDGYSGWIDSKTIHYLDETGFENLKNKKTRVLKKAFIYLENESDSSRGMLLGSGSTFFEGEKYIDIFKDRYKISDEVFVKDSLELRNSIQQSALRLLNTPYLWGGRSSFGADCSGFVQNIYKQAGISIPRDTSEQSKIGETVNFFHETHTGDLAFFDDEESVIKHVGLILEGNRIIHSSGKVKIDKLDHQGIYSEELGKYTHKLRLIKNII